MNLKLPVKALLMLDNASIYQQELECEGYIVLKLLFLPPNITSLTQPMELLREQNFFRKF